jgi:hypothetical protein
LDNIIGVLLTFILCLMLRILHLWVFVVTIFSYLIKLHGWFVITLCFMLVIATMTKINSSSTIETMFTFDMFLVDFSLQFHQYVVVKILGLFEAYNICNVYIVLNLKFSGKARRLFLYGLTRRPCSFHT